MVWLDISYCTGISFVRSEVTMAMVTDGSSNTYCLGEKCMNPDYYVTGQDSGDDWNMYSGLSKMTLTEAVAAATLSFLARRRRRATCIDRPCRTRQGAILSAYFGSATLGHAIRRYATASCVPLVTRSMERSSAD